MLWLALSLLLLFVLSAIWLPFWRRGKGQSPGKPLALSLALIVLIGGGYGLVGEPARMFESRSSSQDAFAMLDEDEIRDLRIQKLHQALQSDLENTELWTQLGYAYLYTNAFEDALLSFQVASQQAPERADLVSAQGIAHYYQAGQVMSEQATHFIQQALGMDPEETNALLLLASDHFQQGRYSDAIEQWQLVLDSGVKDIDRATIIEQINTARMFR